MKLRALLIECKAQLNIVHIIKLMMSHPRINKPVRNYLFYSKVKNLSLSPNMRNFYFSNIK